MSAPEPVLWAHTIVRESDLPWMIAEQAAAERLAVQAVGTETRAFYADRARRLSQTIAAIKAQTKEHAHG